MEEIPGLFKEPKKYLDALGSSISNSIINEVGKDSIDEGADSYQVEPNYLSVTAHRVNNLGILDLKPYFESSPFVKTTKDGGWYLRVPIRRLTSGMSSQLYKEARQIELQSNQTMKTAWINSLYSGRQESSIASLNYTPVSNNLTRLKNDAGRGTKYIAFRTVSDKSNPASWILNRGQATEDNMSKTLLKNLNRLVNYRLQHLNN